MITWMLMSLALAGSPEGTLNADVALNAVFRPGLSAQVDYGVFKGLYVAGRLSSQNDAYAVASNLGNFTETGSWYHSLYIGGGLRAVLGRNDRWDIDYGVLVGSEFAFIRETVVYENSGQQPPYSVRDRRQFQSWQAYLTPLPTVRFRFAKNHGVVFQTLYSLSNPAAIERAHVLIGWTSRWGGGRIGSGGDERAARK
ncbi:MAG: hypothetical protein AAGA48_23905 [Myxococcota bacterium]